MMRNGQRVIKVKKSELLEKLRENKLLHINQYNLAVIAYKLEAIEQLTKLLKNVENGKLNLNLNLEEPVDNSKNYDKIISMFEWEVEDTVELTQDEFKEYVLDETVFTERAKMSNTMYSSKWL